MQAGGVDGKYQLVVKLNNYPYVSQDFGVTWTQVPHYGSWYGAAVSDTGQHMVVAGQAMNVYVSNDYGVTWNARYISSTFRRARISSTGQVMIVSDVNGNLHRSTDYGLTWGSFASGRGIEFAISGDGQYIIAHSIYGNVFAYSSNFGQTWTSRTLSDAFDLRGTPAMSKDGQYQGIVGLDTFVNRGTTFRRSRVWMSTDYGATFAIHPTVIPGSQTASFASFLAISGNGQYWITSYYITAGSSRISSDFGSTWTPLSPHPNNTSISHTGKYMVGSLNDAIYNSEDFGESFNVAFSGYTYGTFTAINNHP